MPKLSQIIFCFKELCLITRWKHLPSCYFRPYNLQDVSLDRQILIRFIIRKIEYNHERRQSVYQKSIYDQIAESNQHCSMRTIPNDPGQEAADTHYPSSSDPATFTLPVNGHPLHALNIPSRSFSTVWSNGATPSRCRGRGGYHRFHAASFITSFAIYTIWPSIEKQISVDIYEHKSIGEDQYHGNCNNRSQWFQRHLIQIDCTL